MLFVHLISMKQITRPPLPKPQLPNRKGMIRIVLVLVTVVSRPLISKVSVADDLEVSETPPSPTSSESSWTTIEAPASETGTDFLGDENAGLYADLLKDVDARNKGKGKGKSALPTTGPATTSRTFIFSSI